MDDDQNTSISPTLKFLIDMGFPEYLCSLAITNCYGKSPEQMIMWMIDQQESFEVVPRRVEFENFNVAPVDNVRYKMVIVVRLDLSMSKGKTASQTVHAALGCNRKAKAMVPTFLNIWESQGEPVVCLQCKDDHELSIIEECAENAGLVYCAVRDAGRTEVQSGTRTCLAIGPAEVDLIDSITGHLKLLK